MSTLQVQVPDPSGTKCCDCKAQVGCNCAGPPCVMVCRSVATSAQFCGFIEYVQSTPPNWYHIKTLSGGSETNCIKSLSRCTPPGQACSQTWLYQGSYQYDPVTCLETGGATLMTDGGCDGNPFQKIVTDVNLTDGVQSCISVSMDLVVSQKSNANQLVGGNLAGQCNIGGTNGCICVGQAAGVVYDAVLSDGDTVAQAIFRQTGPNPAWVEQAQGSPLANTSYTTLWNSSGIFAFRKSQLQVAIPAAAINHTYKITINISERALGGGGPFVPEGIMEVTVTSGQNWAALTPWIDMPIIPGQELLASQCSVVDIT